MMTTALVIFFVVSLVLFGSGLYLWFVSIKAMVAAEDALAESGLALQEALQKEQEALKASEEANAIFNSLASLLTQELEDALDSQEMQ